MCVREREERDKRENRVCFRERVVCVCLREREKVVGVCVCLRESRRERACCVFVCESSFSYSYFVGKR